MAIEKCVTFTANQLLTIDCQKYANASRATRTVSGVTYTEINCMYVCVCKTTANLNQFMFVLCGAFIHVKLETCQLRRQRCKYRIDTDLVWPSSQCKAVLPCRDIWKSFAIYYLLLFAKFNQLRWVPNLTEFTDWMKTNHWQRISSRRVWFRFDWTWENLIQVYFKQ